jgi:3-oxoacyl-[acyl-carrier-protein] synthase-1
VRPLAIQAVGAFTGAGSSAPRALGSLRLGLKFFGELPTLDANGDPLIGAPTPLDLKAVRGVERLVTMGAVAFGECASKREGPAALLLCLPRPVGDASVPEKVLTRLSAEAPFPIDAAASRAFAGGRTAVFDALAEAERLLSTRVVSSVYLGGVDSLIDREPIDRALRAGQLKVGTVEGFVPGEGAAFLRLGVSLEEGTLGILSGRGLAAEPAPRGAGHPNTGEGLAGAARAALADAGASISVVGAFLHDASGDRFGFREAAMAVSRLGPRAEPAPAVWAPGTCTGELGAAYGPFALAAAATFLHRKVAAGPAALVLGTSDGPARGAAVVTLPPTPAQPPRRR